MLDTTQDIEVTDVLAAVIFGVEREISRLTTGKELEALRETWFDRFWHFLKTTEVSVPRAGSAVVGEMKTNPSLRGLVRSKINKQPWPLSAHFPQEKIAATRCAEWSPAGTRVPSGCSATPRKR